MPKYTEKAEIMSLPVIPMRGIVAFPSIPISFEIERSFSVAACEEALDGDMLVLLVAQRDTACDNPGREDMYDVGCVARIKQSVKTPEDIIRVIADGMCRARIMGWHHGEDGVITADVMTKTVSLEGDADVRTKAAMRVLISALEERSGQHRVSREMLMAAHSISSPGLLADFVASSAFVRWEDKQMILDEFDPIRRINIAIKLLEDEKELLDVEALIQERVREQISASQRDHYLREQLRVIQDELGDGDEDDFYGKITSAPLPDEVRAKLLKEYNHLQQVQFGSPENALLRNYLETCLALPWTETTRDRVDIKAAERILNEDHDGLTKIKNRIIEYLAVKQLSPELKHQIICLVGPPGTGKTSIAASVARAMKRKYVRVSLGGVRDEADIRGHRKTYIGAMPGRIITALTQVGVKNPLMLFDEIDKLTRDSHGDPSAALLEVLDAEQNKNFRDHFVELPFDLSDCMFICTANTLDTVPKPLLDRMEVIELSAYTRGEKLSIAKNHLIPKQCKRHGLDRRRFRLSDEAVYELIDYYTAEAGVRNLEREIASLCRKAARRLVSGEVKSVRIGSDDVKAYLGSRKMMPERISPVSEIGVVNGMAYTSVGGDLLKIEVTVMEGTGKLELTGSLGDVMKESAHLGISYIRAHAKELSVPSDFYKTRDIHIHVPEGAVPKDGPSAGVTMLSAMVSALSRRHARSDTSMTGELTLTGRVLAIGGLKEKTSAAYAAGVKNIIIPKDNESDLEEIDPTVRENVNFILASRAEDVLGFILESPAESAAKPMADSIMGDICPLPSGTPYNIAQV